MLDLHRHRSAMLFTDYTRDLLRGHFTIYYTFEVAKIILITRKCFYMYFNANQCIIMNKELLEIDVR